MVHSIPILPPYELPTGSAAVQDTDFCFDNGGNTFWVRLIVPGNDTFVEVFKVTAAGAVSKIDEFEPAMGAWTGHPEGHTKKAVAVVSKIKGADVVCGITCYELTEPNRNHWQEQYVTRNVAVPFPQGVSPESGAGPAVFYASGGEPDPEPGGEPVDYALIKTKVHEALGLADGVTLVQAISGSASGQIRQGIEDKVKDALSELFQDPPQSAIEGTFQGRYFPYVKNAAANPLANVLGGQDAWGRARREELKAIIREVLDEYEEVEP